LPDENSRDRIFRAVRERIQEADEQERIQMITNVIGDCRYRDLVDIVAKIEGEDGWSTALEYLIKSEHGKYISPLTIGQNKTDLEILKFREMIFELFFCKGLEPVSIDTTNLLEELADESSFVDASRALFARLEQLAKEQIQTGDTLFFDLFENTSISQELLNLVSQVRNENIQNVSLDRNDSQFNVESLWYCEHSRIVMSMLGVKGFIIDSDTLDSVLSVIQKPNSIKSKIVDVSSFRNSKESSWNRPTNSTYKKLLSHIVHQKVTELSLLGSRHAVPLLNTLLDQSSSVYEDSSSTISYKEMLDCINAHISVRNIDSIISLEKSSKMKNTRIATTATLALGNFYHETSVNTLATLLCNKRSKEIQEAAAKAIQNVYRKCPEADHVIADFLDGNCKNHGKLKKLYRQLSKEKPVYYQ
jgi:hypothetical protein